MPDELSRLLDGVRHDADAVVLGDPGALRRVGTRRSRMRSGLGVALVAIVLVTGSVAVSRVATRGAPVVTPPPVPSVSSESASPSASAPAATFAQDMCELDAKTCKPPIRVWFEEKLPSPCTSTWQASDTKVTARRSRSVFPDPFDRSLVYGQTFTRYRDGGAQQYFDELLLLLNECSSVRRETAPGHPDSMMTLRYKRIALGGLGGSDSMLGTRTWAVGGIDRIFHFAVVRIDDVVVVVYDNGKSAYQPQATTVPMDRAIFDAGVVSSIEEAQEWT